MEAFIFSLMGLSGVVIFRYVWTHIQCRRAIKLTNDKAVRHIYKCKDAFKIIYSFPIGKEDKKQLCAEIRKVLSLHSMYWDEYKKHANFNEIWLNPKQWTLRQIFPSLVDMELKVEIDGEEI